MSVNIIVATGKVTDKGYPIGVNGKIPWHCKEDLKWFKKMTKGHPVIMGRKTYESIGHKLENRINIVITTKNNIKEDDDLIITNNLEKAIEIAKSYDNEVFIIGGASIYEYAINNDLVDYIYMDCLKEEILNADAFFSKDFFNKNYWEVDTEKSIEIIPNYAYVNVFFRKKGINNHVDEQYLSLIKEIINNGEKKDTRAGKTHSLFSKQLRFNLKEGFPILTTKKIFSKGVIYELLWFLKGDTNIKYLVDNGVHIWDDDAYRYYLELVKNENLWRKDIIKNNKKVNIPLIILTSVDKETFLNNVKNCSTEVFSHLNKKYTYGDLNNVYGYQWIKWGGHNQIQEVINTLKTNPDDRRMIISAWNVEDIPNMALPPCHFCCQFYTKKMTLEERQEWIRKKRGEDVGENIELLDEWNVPTRKLSCVWHQRSVDCGLGLCWNIFSYGLLTHMIAQCANMDVDELIFDGGDCHVYDNHIEPLKEQMKNNPHMYALPTLKLNPDIKNIFDFNYEDIKIIGYESYPSIKMPLSVGL